MYPQATYLFVKITKFKVLRFLEFQSQLFELHFFANFIMANLLKNLVLFFTQCL